MILVKNATSLTAKEKNLKMVDSYISSCMLIIIPFVPC